MSRGRRIAAWVLAAAFVLAGWVATPMANAGDAKPKLRPPALLWKSYPLQQRPRATDRPKAGPAGSPGATSPRVGSPRVGSPQAGEARSPTASQERIALLVSVLLVSSFVMGVIVLLRSSLPARVGGSVHARDRARFQVTVQGPPRAEPQRPPPEPAGDLLEALRPQSPSESERRPERAVRGEERAPHPNPVRTRNRPVARPTQLEQARPARSAATAEAFEATTDVEPEPPPPMPGAHRPAATVERCEIRLWRGYVKCQLYAILAGSEHPLFVSRHFRLRDDRAPGADAQGALTELLTELERNGWIVVSAGAIWYQQRLQRVAPQER